ncbi:unnamed protein product [Mytilus coruscus]|uniref:Uncharacterized protein n=1 Tax=Mytilus coruscus TaxID=42192 RepID=A0A6J8CY08_MYTCO|nr:unnamed protein product [Mytilus coruscus]
MDCEHVTKSQDKVAKRHERLGTQIIYENLDNKDVSIKIHEHERNLVVNTFVRDTQFTVNWNDLWHAVKISKGTKRSEGITWSVQLGDTVVSIATHMNWAVRNCKQNYLKLEESLDNIVEHYCYNHVNCHHTSRCKVDSNYEPSRIVQDDNDENKDKPNTYIAISDCRMYEQLIIRMSDYLCVSDEVWSKEIIATIEQQENTEVRGEIETGTTTEQQENTVFRGEIETGTTTEQQENTVVRGEIETGTTIEQQENTVVRGEIETGTTTEQQEID